VLTIWSRQSLPDFPIIIELSPLPLLKFTLMPSLISKLMVTCLDDRMVNTRNIQNGAENSHGNGNPPPPSSLAQAIASILESRDEQTELLRQLIANSTRGGNGARSAPAPTTYSDFSVAHPPLFTDAGELLEADHGLQMMESKFGLLRCTEMQKTLFTVQQLRGDASTWWANYTTTRPADYQISWAEFHDALRAYYIPTGVMRKKCQEFMDLKQGERSVHDYSKQFNHLAQYALDQVDTDEKKKDRFMIGLSTKLQEQFNHLAQYDRGRPCHLDRGTGIGQASVRPVRRPPRRKAEDMGRIQPMRSLLLFIFVCI
jgi:hypothetical protein